jgi:MFS family permease
MGGIAMTITAASIALAGIQRELQLGIAQLQWVLNSFIVSYALLLLPFGAWSDRRGQRPLFICGAIVFVIGAAAAVLARDITVLIAGRAIQGVGSALLTSRAPAALTLAFSNEPDRKRAFGYLGSSGGIGLALGAVLAGAVSSSASWRAALALPIPVMIAALAVVCCSPGALAGRPKSHRIVPLRAPPGVGFQCERCVGWRLSGDCRRLVVLAGCVVGSEVARARTGGAGTLW